MQDFDYIRASSIDEVVSLLSQDRDGTRILCGGTDLLVQLREGQKTARLLIDIKSIPEVNELSYDPLEGLRIGAALPCYHIRSHPEVVRHYPGLLDAVSLIGGTQIQGRASLGGNLCNASPAADSIPALIVHRAVCLIAGPDGTRQMPVEAFCTAPGQTVLGRGEFLLAFHLPPPPPRFGAAYVRFIPRNEMDIAVAGTGVSVILDESQDAFASARVALAAVAPTPLFVPQVGEFLQRRNITSETIAEAARLAREAARPISDMRGTVVQRRHLSGVLTRRALEKAIQRAKT
jgi:carbon-monoxide dehydrogenase medium subunit